jgi:hypothetical protein
MMDEGAQQISLRKNELNRCLFQEEGVFVMVLLYGNAYMVEAVWS